MSIINPPPQHGQQQPILSSQSTHKHSNVSLLQKQNSTAHILTDQIAELRQDYSKIDQNVMLYDQKHHIHHLYTQQFNTSAPTSPAQLLNGQNLSKLNQKQWQQHATHDEMHLDRIQSIQKLDENDGESQIISNLEPTDNNYDKSSIQYYKPVCYAQSQMKQLSQVDLNATKSQPDQDRCVISADNSNRPYNTKQMSKSLKNDQSQYKHAPIAVEHHPNKSNQDYSEESDQEEVLDSATYSDTTHHINSMQQQPQLLLHQQRAPSTKYQQVHSKTQKVSTVVSPTRLRSIDCMNESTGNQQQPLLYIDGGKQQQLVEERSRMAQIEAQSTPHQLKGNMRTARHRDKEQDSRKRGSKTNNNLSQTNVSVIPRSQINFDSSNRKTSHNAKQSSNQVANNTSEAGGDDYKKNLNLIMKQSSKQSAAGVKNNLLQSQIQQIEEDSVTIDEQQQQYQIMQQLRTPTKGIKAIDHQQISQKLHNTSKPQKWTNQIDTVTEQHNRRKSSISRNSIKSEGSTTQLKKKVHKVPKNKESSTIARDQLPLVYEQSLTSNVYLVQAKHTYGQSSKLSKQRSITKISKNQKNHKKHKIDKQPSFLKSPQSNVPNKGNKQNHKHLQNTDQMVNKHKYFPENNQVSIYNSVTNIEGLDSEDNSPNINSKTPGSLAMNARDSFQNVRNSIPNSYLNDSSINQRQSTDNQRLSLTDANQSGIKLQSPSKIPPRQRFLMSEQVISDSKQPAGPVSGNEAPQFINKFIQQDISQESQQTIPRKRRPPTPVRPLAESDEFQQNQNKKVAKEIQSMNESQQKNRSFTQENKFQPENQKHMVLKIQPLNQQEKFSDLRSKRISKQNLSVDIPNKLAKFHQKQSQPEPSFKQIETQKHRAQDMQNIMSVKVSKQKLQATPMIGSNIQPNSTSNFEKTYKSKTKKFQELMNGGSDRQNQLEILKTRFDKGIGQGQKYFEAQMQLRNRKKKGNRIVMFQLDPEPGSALEIDSPLQSPSKSPKKLAKNKVLNFDKLYMNNNIVRFPK